MENTKKRRHVYVSFKTRWRTQKKRKYLSVSFKPRWRTKKKESIYLYHLKRDGEHILFYLCNLRIHKDFKYKGRRIEISFIIEWRVQIIDNPLNSNSFRLINH